MGHRAVVELLESTVAETVEVAEGLWAPIAVED